MSLQPPSPAKAQLVRVGRILLGIAVGASFGVFIGALVASWIWGVEAIESEKVGASYVAAGITILGAMVGGAIGFKVGRAPSTVTDSDPSVSRR